MKRLIVTLEQPEFVCDKLARDLEQAIHVYGYEGHITIEDDADIEEFNRLMEELEAENALDGCPAEVACL